MHNKVLEVFHIEDSTVISNSLYTTDNWIMNHLWYQKLINTIKAVCTEASS